MTLNDLGGRTKTSIIATISPVSSNLEETLCTLDYAQCARSIQNRPELNQKMTKKTLIKEYTNEIEKLRKDLIAAREKNGIYLAEENYNDITSKLETQAAVIKELEDNIGAITDGITKLSEIFTETQSKLDETTKTLDYTTDQLCSTQHELHTTKRDRDEQKHLVGHHVRSERALYSQAKKLLTTSDESTADVSGLHSKLDRKHEVERHNLDTQATFQTRFSDDITNMAARLSSFAQQQREMSDAVQENIGQTLTAHKERLEVFVQYLGKLSCSVEEGHDNLTTRRMDQLASNTAWAEEKLSYVRDTCRDASKSVSQRCHEQLQPTLWNIEQQLAQLTQHMADLSGYVKQQATTQQEMVQDFVKGEMAGLESIVVSVAAYAKDRETSVNALEQKVEEMTKANDSLQPIASLLMKTFNEQSQTYKQVGEELTESRRANTEFFNVRLPTYSRQCHAAEAQFSESYASALKTSDESVGKKIKMMNSARQIAETKNSEAQKCVIALEHDSTQRWTDMNASLIPA
ncbi:PREDICTED: kinesin-like protein KIF11 [Priapulus caudatus]|uniref:Kinesin-like protein KIF11 n=1 Tax=Priapulus caudatus TaxID=37621 RepID=A0ABM1EMR2_PRICU|nr:PREDICTED: kinesin-like protein KIF11 [Priapulus caudatus]